MFVLKGKIPADKIQPGWDSFQAEFCSSIILISCTKNITYILLTIKVHDLWNSEIQCSFTRALR